MIAGPYMGRDFSFRVGGEFGWMYMFVVFRNLNMKLQKTLREYLEARGVNNELSVFLHEYMTNSDRIEFINWLSTVKSCVEK
ncbi:hypothetical protein SLEP1_g15540 [Rubroshorea leprosula]|uniref:Uncharacterized protein n=1 Tax=Rubroshorea leprosula TaxID=152421 RepID=A0AAV5IYF1_9ROSI|nr:hypothetical protein SLEP1_g15540 [Rubroshorea leprosula]